MASRRREGSRTKTAVPGLGSRFVAVRRLSTRLSNSDARLVTLVGPAGSGKTTLVASYVLAEKRPTLWYQLDAHDADASAFFNELTHAARRRCFGAETVLPAFDALLEPEVFASRLARAIAQALPERGLVVFDCGERAPDDSLVWVVVRELASALRRDCRALVCSRTPVPPTLARMTVAVPFDAVSADDLVLRPDEARAVAAASHPKAPAAETAERARRSEGWVAGILLGGTAPGRGDSELDRFFTHEVLSELPGACRRAFFELCRAGELDRELADRLCGDREAIDFTSSLAQRQSFVAALESGGWRFHDLLREHAERQLDSEPEFAADEYSARTARALEEVGRGEDAIPIWIDLGRLDEASRVLKANRQQLLMEGRIHLVAGTLARMPRDQIEADPWLLGLHAMLQRFSSTDEALSAYERAAEALEARGDEEGLAVVLGELLDTFHLAGVGLERAERHVVRAIALAEAGAISPPHAALLGFATMTDFLRTGDRVTTCRRAEKALAALPVDSELGRLRPYLLGYHAIALAERGLASQALAQIEQADRELLAFEERAPVPAGVANITIAIAETLLGSTQQTLARTDRLLVRVRDWGLTMLSNHVHLRRAWAHLVDGRTELARQDLSRIRTDEPGHGLVPATVARLEAWVALSERAPNAVQRVEDAVARAAKSGCGLFLHANNTLLAAALADAGESLRAERILERELEYCRENGDCIGEFGALLELAGLRRNDGSSATTYEAALTRAFEFGAMHRILLSHSIRPHVHSPLCADALARAIQPEYTRLLIRERSLPAPSPNPAESTWPWRVEVFSLGRLEIRVNGARFDLAALPGSRALDLLAALIALGARDVALHELAACVWPESEGDHAQQNLEFALRRLRAAFDADVIVVKNRTASFDGRVCWLDQWALLDHVRAGRRGSSQGQTEITVKELARAAELCGGALLPGHHAAAILGRRAEWRLRQMEVLGAAARVAEPEARRVLQERFALIQAGA